jgi:hypothetical protein
MGIRDQCIEIGFSIKSIIRCVYDIKDNNYLRFQTGFVQYDNNEIPVWRQFDPNNKLMNAPWRKGKWENIYNLRMNHKKGSKHIEYEIDDVDFEGVSISLPKVSSELAHSFKSHLKKYNC